MKTTLPTWIASTFAVVVLAQAAATLKAAPVVGEAAPNFSLTDVSGKTHSLADLKGKYVVLEWVNPQCPFVKKHYGSGNMQKLQEEYTRKGVVWLSINSSATGKEGYVTPDQGKEWVKKEKAASSALLLDSDGKVGKLYDAKTTPQMFIINPEGKLLYDGAIDSIKSADAADIAKAENYVKVGLDEAMSGKALKTSKTKSYGCSVKY
jgi:peroxiredoxin